MADDRVWHVYLVRCRDRSLYCGIALDLDKRIAQHNAGPRAARYTRARRPVELVWSEPAGSRAQASRREAHIKRLSAAEKHMLCTDKPGTTE